MQSWQIAALLLGPLVLPLISALLWWRTLARPFLFTVVGFLSVLGLNAMVAPVTVATFLFDAAAGRYHQMQAYANGMLAASLIEVAAAAVLLVWLRRGLRKPVTAQRMRLS